MRKFFKKLRLIYTHTSGNGVFKTELDSVISILSKKYDISIFRANNLTEIEVFMKNLKKGDYDVIVAAGGDGTLNTVSSYIIKNELDCVFGMIPAGTSNDFAKKIGISRSFSYACENLLEENIKEIDVGLVSSEKNNSYFINVFGVGALTNVSNYVNQQFKSALGNVAYYSKGIETLFKPMPSYIKITTKDKTYEDEFLFLLIMNSGSAGGFNIVKNASITDGKFDFIGVLNKGPSTIPALLVRLVMENHLEDDRVIYFKSDYAKIETKRKVETNLDGEKGPSLPAEISLLHKKLKVIFPKERRNK